MRCEPQETWSDSEEEITPDMLRNKYINKNDIKIQNLIRHTVQIINGKLSAGTKELIESGSIDVGQKHIFPNKSFDGKRLDLKNTWQFINKAVQDIFTSWNIESNRAGGEYYFRFHPGSDFTMKLDKKSEKKKKEEVVVDSSIDNRSEILDI